MAGDAIDFVPVGLEAGGETPGGAPKIRPLLDELPCGRLLAVVADGELLDGCLVANDQTVEAVGFGGDVGLPALVGCSLTLDPAVDQFG
jgi:hypothetical protein